MKEVTRALSKTVPRMRSRRSLGRDCSSNRFLSYIATGPYARALKRHRSHGDDAMDILFTIAYLLLAVYTDSNCLNCLVYMIVPLLPAGVNALNKPDSVTWNLEDHNLVVSWKHSDQQELLQGFYISICQINNSKCGAPDFVHFNSEFRTAKIIGLAPESSYKLKVC